MSKIQWSEMMTTNTQQYQVVQQLPIQYTGFLGYNFLNCLE